MSKQDDKIYAYMYKLKKYNISSKFYILKTQQFLFWLFKGYGNDLRCENWTCNLKLSTNSIPLLTQNRFSWQQNRRDPSLLDPLFHTGYIDPRFWQRKNPCNFSQRNISWLIGSETNFIPSHIIRASQLLFLRRKADYIFISHHPKQILRFIRIVS